MHLPDAAATLAGLETAAAKVVLVATGGGTRAIAHLASTPGASSVVLEGLVPYARAAIDRLLGGPQEAYCSSRTARRLAVAAWQRARDLGAAADAAVAAAVTASLRTTVPKRGDHRLCVAVQTLRATATAELVLEKAARSRDEEETLAAALLLAELVMAGGGQAAAGPALVLRPGEQVSRARHRVEDLLVRGIGGRVERDREAVGDGGLGHGRIIQLAGRGMPFKTAGFGVE